MKATVDGVRLSYEEAGAGDAVIFLHGSSPGASGRSGWPRTLETVAAQGYRAIAPDVVGFGDSGRPEDFTYDAAGWAASVRGLMAHLGLQSAHLVGNSMGGRIALSLACRTPELVRSLTLVGVRSPGDALQTGIPTIRAYQPSLENMRRLMTELFVVDPAIVTDEMVEQRYAASVQAGEHEHYQRMFADSASNELDVNEDDIRSLAVATMIFHGREDRVIPVESAYAMAALVPQMTLVVAGRCGHWPQIEQADLFHRQLASFLASVGPST